MEGRKERALQQRLYLLEAERKDGGWKFIVRGSTGSRYTVSISDNNLLCNCFDCKKRKSVCKHIYFIVGRVAAHDELLKNMGNSLNSQILDEITPRLLGRLRVEPKEQEKPRDTMCSICYEDLDNDIKTCYECKNGYHDGCLEIWLRNKETCPMCRKLWLSDDFGLSKLSI